MLYSRKHVQPCCSVYFKIEALSFPWMRILPYSCFFASHRMCTHVTESHTRERDPPNHSCHPPPVAPGTPQITPSILHQSLPGPPESLPPSSTSRSQRESIGLASASLPNLVNGITTTPGCSAPRWRAGHPSDSSFSHPWLYLLQVLGPAVSELRATWRYRVGVFGVAEKRGQWPDVLQK